MQRRHVVAIVPGSPPPWQVNAAMGAAKFSGDARTAPKDAVRPAQGVALVVPHKSEGMLTGLVSEKDCWLPRLRPSDGESRFQPSCAPG